MNAQQARIFRSFSQLVRYATGFASIAARETGGIRDLGFHVQPGRGVRMLITSATLPCLSRSWESTSLQCRRLGSWGRRLSRRTFICRVGQRLIHFTPSRSMATSETSTHFLPNLKDPSLLKNLGLIDGKWVGARDGKTMPVYNPATGQVVAEVPVMGAEETGQAIAAAHEAFKTWSKTTAKERSKLLKNLYNLLIENKEDLATLMTVEQGKPLAEARGEIDYGASFVEWFAEEAKRTYGDIVPSPRADTRIMVLKQPVGVIAAITPWNFPVAMATRKIAPALAAGCTAVLKPAELTPLSATAVAELAIRAGIPPGVLNVVIGDAKSIGETMLKSKEVRKLTFTGSTPIGKLLMKGAADTVKKISLELGGNAPFIVFDDANVQLAAKGALGTKYRNMGQTCVCANRLLVQEGVYDEFAAAFQKDVARLKVGNGLHKGVTQGPLIDERAVKKIESHVEDALAKGARLVLGGKRHEAGPLFYEPTILLDATPDMLATREENFGPVAPIMKFKTEEEAIQIANDTEYGLAAYFYTENLARAWRISEQLEYGMVGMNESIISAEAAPFGGIKQSGLGREGSKYGIDEYMEMKYVMFGNITS